MSPFRTPTRRRLHGALLLTVAGLAAVPASPAAAAGTVTVTKSASTLAVTGGPEANSITVGFTTRSSGGQGTWVVVDTTSTLSAGPGCTATSATQVTCAGNGSGDRVSVDAGAGDDRITYRFGLPSTLKGGAGADTVVGGSGPDTILATGGDPDRIDGGAGPDKITGGGGDDVLDGGDGDDAISGQGSDDTITGGVGNDELTGSKGDDTLRGGPGNDTMFGNNGADSLTGDAGVDSAEGSNFNDIESFIDTCDAETEIRCEK